MSRWQRSCVSDVKSRCKSFCWWLGRRVNARFFERSSHRHGAFVCILYHIRQCFGWGGADNVPWRLLFMKWHSCGYAGHCLGGWGGGGRGGAMIGDDNVLGGTFLMFHAKEVTFRLLRYAGHCLGGFRGGGVGGATKTFLIVRSWCCILTKWHSCCCALFVVHELILLLLVPCGSCTWSDIRVATLCTLRGTWVLLTRTSTN